MFELSQPWFLILLPAPWLVWRFARPRREQVLSTRVPFFRSVAKAAGVVPRHGSVVLSRTKLQMAAAIVVWTLLVLALARPEWVGEPVEITKASRDVMLAIDISGSMDDRDFGVVDGQPLQRLEAVKRVVDRFVEDREGDRFGLIVFGTRAFVQSPLTEDLRTVRELLANTEVGMAGPHTAIGDAIGLAIRHFEVSAVERRLLILLSDGADTGSRMSPLNAAEIAAQNGIEIYTIGVGDPAASGEDRVDLAALEDIAARSGGRFFSADDETGLAEIYDRIDQLAPREVETLSFRPRRPLTHWPVGGAALLALSVVAILQFSGRRRQTI